MYIIFLYWFVGLAGDLITKTYLPTFTFTLLHQLLFPPLATVCSPKTLHLIKFLLHPSYFSLYIPYFYMYTIFIPKVTEGTAKLTSEIEFGGENALFSPSAIKTFIEPNNRYINKKSIQNLLYTYPRSILVPDNILCQNGECINFESKLLSSPTIQNRHCKFLLVDFK